MGEIASMSLDLLLAVRKHKISHRPNETLKLRIGKKDTRAQIKNDLRLLNDILFRIRNAYWSSRCRGGGIDDATVLFIRRHCEHGVPHGE